MKFLVILFSLCLTFNCYAEFQPQIPGLDRAVTVSEIDGSPIIYDTTTLKVTNGTLTDNADGTATITISGTGDLLADGSVPMTADWDIGNFDITLKALTGDGTVEGATLTEGGNAVPNATDKLSFFSSTSSSELFGVLSDETGSAAGTPLAVFSVSPSLVGVIGTGGIEFGGATFLKIPSSASPTTDATGKMAVDTDLITQGMLQVYLASAIANVVATTDTPGDNEVPTYDAGGGTIQWEAGGGGGGASTALDNLASVAINTSIFSDAADTDDLGSTTKEWANLYVGDAGKIYLGLGQDASIERSAANEMTLVATSGVTVESVKMDGGVITGATLAAASNVIEADTVLTITTLAPDTATTQATQAAITSLGTLTGLTIGVDAIGTAQTVGESLINATAAAAAAQQYSPVFELEGQGWKTAATAGSQEVKWGLQTRPVEGAANPTGVLDILSSINAGAYAAKASLTSAGAFSTVGAITGSNLSGTNTGDNTVATSGDSATAFFSSGTIEHEYGGLEANVSAYSGLAKITGGTTTELKVNWSDTVAPANATDDITLGYIVGSRWLDTTADKEYVCLDNTDTAAVWTETTVTAAGDVTSASNITEHSVVRGADAAKGVELSTVFITDAGEMYNASQPCFLVENASQQANIATGSAITVVFATEIQDKGSDFASNTFTAPIGGMYQLSCIIPLYSMDDASDNYQLSIVTSNRTYTVIMDPGVWASDPIYWVLGSSIVADMDANDTAYITVTQATGTAQTDIDNPGAKFSGALLN